MQWLKNGAALPLANLKEVLVVDDTQLANLRSGTDAERLVAVQKLAQRFNELWNSVRDLIRPLEDEIKSAKKMLQQLAVCLNPNGSPRRTLTGSHGALTNHSCSK
jgi:hypothetical protein